MKNVNQNRRAFIAGLLAVPLAPLLVKQEEYQQFVPFREAVEVVARWLDNQSYTVKLGPEESYYLDNSDFNVWSAHPSSPWLTEDEIKGL